jgi:predicted RNase H-like nuclease
MTAQRTFIGIDGCRAGWFCVLLDAAGRLEYRLMPDARALGELAAAADSVLIDIPIGLVEAGPGGRVCDRAARQQLGARAASVFSPPARGALAARSYAEALALNRKVTGRGLSLQTWGLVPKIRAIDRLLRTRTALRGVLRECHPELCFQALNNGQVMQYPKKQPAGARERLTLLERCLPGCQALYEQACGQFLRREVARDDILDALACALTAWLGGGTYRTLPDEPPQDGQDLAMEIVYGPGRVPRRC